jgi:hypothetical protein
VGLYQRAQVPPPVRRIAWSGKGGCHLLAVAAERSPKWPMVLIRAFVEDTSR